LGKFLGLYILGNLVYGIFIGAYESKPDPLTRIVTRQTSWCLNTTGSATSVLDHKEKASIAIIENGVSVIRVFEGCMGINVLIIFMAFVLTCAGTPKAIWWFIPVGLIIIHICNLLRIGLLYVVAQYYEQYFYYVHKYFFTAILYLVVFALWAVWVIRFNKI